MTSRILRSLSVVLAFVLLSQALAHGQDQPAKTLPGAVDIRNSWESASSRAPSKGKLLVITMAQPTRRIACRIQSFTADQLTCKAHFGKSRIYKSHEVAAIITPGDYNDRFPFLVGLNAVAAATAWGAYALVPVCLPCAVATAIVAGLIFFANGAILMADDRPDLYLYLAPANKLHDPKGNPIQLKPLP